MNVCGWMALLYLLSPLFISLSCVHYTSMQWQQICQNICGCYGDGYKEPTWSWLLKEIENERKREREEEIVKQEKIDEP